MCGYNTTRNHQQIIIVATSLISIHLTWGSTVLEGEKIYISIGVGFWWLDMCLGIEVGMARLKIGRHEGACEHQICCMHGGGRMAIPVIIKSV